MSIAVNHVRSMYDLRGKIIDKFGKDETGSVIYRFNGQGWRNNKDHDFIPQHVFFGNSSVFGIGVEQDKIFPAMFHDQFNCGFAQHYTNHDIAMSVLNYVHSSKFCPKAKMAIVWSDRNPEIIDRCFDHVKHLNIQHFFCGQPVRGKNCWPMIPCLDKDVSGTHMGPATHKRFYRILCALFRQ